MRWLRNAFRFLQFSDWEEDAVYLRQSGASCVQQVDDERSAGVCNGVCRVSNAGECGGEFPGYEGGDDLREIRRISSSVYILIFHGSIIDRK